MQSIIMRYVLLIRSELKITTFYLYSIRPWYCPAHIPSDNGLIHEFSLGNGHDSNINGRCTNDLVCVLFF